MNKKPAQVITRRSFKWAKRGEEEEEEELRSSGFKQVRPAGPRRVNSLCSASFTRRREREGKEKKVVNDVLRIAHLRSAQVRRRRRGFIDDARTLHERASERAPGEK